MKAVVYDGATGVRVEERPDVRLEMPKGWPEGRSAQHAVVVRVIASAICGSDHHVIRGRTDAPEGFVLGHEITGEVVEVGSDVLTVSVGDLCSVPFNVACGRCPNCKDGDTALCLLANPGGIGASYGYPGLGPWQGGQAEYVLVPFADFNLLRFPDADAAREKILDLALLSDIFPTGFHGAVSAGIGPGSIAYIAGAGPVGLAAAHSAQLLGAALVIVGDVNIARLAQAASFGCATVDVSAHDSLAEQIEQIAGVPQVDSSVDCVGFMARDGHDGSESGSAVLDALAEITRPAGRIGIPGAYIPDASNPGAASGMRVPFATMWGKAHRITTGGCPVMRYHRPLLNAILHDRVSIAAAVNATAVSLDDAPSAYERFNDGAPVKYVLDPHGDLPRV